MTGDINYKNWRDSLDNSKETTQRLDRTLTVMILYRLFEL